MYMVKGVGLNGTIASVLEQIGYSVADIVAERAGAEIEEAKAAATDASSRPSFKQIILQCCTCDPATRSAGRK